MPPVLLLTSTGAIWFPVLRVFFLGIGVRLFGLVLFWLYRHHKEPVRATCQHRVQILCGRAARPLSPVPAIVAGRAQPREARVRSARFHSTGVAEIGPSAISGSLVLAKTAIGQA